MTEAQEIIARFQQQEKELGPDKEEYKTCYACSKSKAADNVWYALNLPSGVRSVCPPCYRKYSGLKNNYQNLYTTLKKKIITNDYPF